MSEPENTPTTTEAVGASTVTETCAYPDCPNPPEAKAPGRTGPAPKYCEREDHNSVTAWRAKRSANAAASGRPVVEPEAPAPSNSPATDAMASAAVLRGTIEKSLASLLESVPQWLEDLKTAADPEAAEAQIEEATNNAVRMVAAADERTSAEKKLRIAATKRADQAEVEKEEANTAADEAVALLDKQTAAHQAELDRLQEQDQQREAAVQDKLAELEAAKKQLTAEFAQKTTELEEAAEQRIAKARKEIEQDAELRIAAAEKAADEQRKLAEKAAEDLAEAITVRDEAVAAAARVQREAAEAVEAANGKVEANDAATEKALSSMRTDLGQARGRITELEKAQTTRNQEYERVLTERGKVEQRAGRAEILVERLQMLLAQHGIAVPSVQDVAQGKDKR